MTQLFSNFDFSELDSPNFKEDSVRERLILPLLYELSYKESQIERSKSLKHLFVIIGCTERPITIIPDYLLKDEDGNYAWVLEVKAPDKNIKKKQYISQAHSYAIHEDINTKYFSLCNGREFILFETHKRIPVLEFELKNIANHLDELKEYLLPENFHSDLGSISLSFAFNPEFHITQDDEKILEILDRLEFCIKKKLPYSINLDICFSKYNENDIKLAEKEKINFFLSKIKEEIRFKLNLFCKVNIGLQQKNISALKINMSNLQSLISLYEETNFCDYENYSFKYHNNRGKGFDVIKRTNTDEISFRIYLNDEEFDDMLKLANSYISCNITKESDVYDIATFFHSLRLEVFSIENKTTIDKILSRYLTKMWELKVKGEYKEEFQDLSSFTIGLA